MKVGKTSNNKDITDSEIDKEDNNVHGNGTQNAKNDNDNDKKTVSIIDETIPIQLFVQPMDEIYNELLLKAYDLEKNECKGKMETRTIK